MHCMFYESDGLRVTTHDGVATLWLDFPRIPGSPINALNSDRLRGIERACDKVAACAGLEILVILSGKPAGFCGGADRNVIQDEYAKLTFRRECERVFARIRELPIVTIACIHGPCLGPGLALAMACDYRLAIATPDTWLDTLTAREARDRGIVDVACCERRAKIELQLMIDQYQRSPRKRTRWSKPMQLTIEPHLQFDEYDSFPESVMIDDELASNDWRFDLIAEFAMRGTVVYADAKLGIDRFTFRQRLTPLEAEQALKLIKPIANDDASIVLVEVNELAADMPVNVLGIRLISQGNIELTTRETTRSEVIQQLQSCFARMGCQTHITYVAKTSDLLAGRASDGLESSVACASG